MTSYWLLIHSCQI